MLDKVISKDFLVQRVISSYTNSLSRSLQVLVAHAYGGQRRCVCDDCMNLVWTIRLIISSPIIRHIKSDLILYKMKGNLNLDGPKSSKQAKCTTYSISRILPIAWWMWMSGSAWWMIGWWVRDVRDEWKMWMSEDYVCACPNEWKNSYSKLVFHPD